MRVRLLATLLFFALSSTGCAWCVDQCLGPPARPVRAPPKRPPAFDPCELLPGSMFRAANGHLLWFDVDYVEWRHDGISEIFDWRCRDGQIQFREGGYASDAELRGDRELEERGGAERRGGSPPGGRMADQGWIEWLGVVYVLEKRATTL